VLRFALLLCALIPAQGLAGETAAQWKTEIELGKKAVAAHDYTEAMSWFRAALSLAQAPPEDAGGAMDALRNCATLSRLQGHLEDAEQFLSQAVAPATQLYGGESLELASVLSELAMVERSRGKRKDALLNLQSAVRIRESRPENKPEEYARDLTGIATLEAALDDPKAARETLIRALSAWETAVPPDSLQLLPVLEALGGSYRDSAEYDKAEPLYLRALMVREANLGPDSAELLSNLDSLAYVYFGEEKYAEAEPVYKRLLALWESSAGPGHPMVALTLDKMAEFYAHQQRYQDAEKAASAALAIRAAAYLGSLNQTGRVLLMEAKMAEAEDLYRRAVAIGDLAKAPDDRMDPLLRIYAKVLLAVDHPSEADAVDKRVKDALIRKADREGRRPSPVKFPVSQ
jgi:tetratricopeptide (TPR) repeat protein